MQNIQSTERAANDDELYFSDDAASQGFEIEPWKVLIVDDDAEIHDVSRYALQGYEFQDKGVTVLSAYSAEEAKALLSSTPDIAVIILDVVMESRDAGLLFVQFIRKELGNKFARIILRTGQPGEAPEYEVIRAYDVNDYKNKSELTNIKLLTTITAALRSYSDIVELERCRQNLEEIVHERTEKLHNAVAELHVQKTKTDDLLSMMLPLSVAERMKQGEQPIADYFDAVTVLFADIIGFTPLAASRTPQEIVTMLDEIFSAFDTLSVQFGVEKIKTIGNACMVVGGAPDKKSNHTQAIAQMAREMFHAIEEFNRRHQTSLQMRAGIHLGEVAAGVIGKRRFSYDLWGDTVNIASQMEMHGEAGKIHCTESARNALSEIMTFEERGLTDIKGKGAMKTYFLAP